MTIISAFGIGLTYGMHSLLSRVLVSIFYDAPPTTTPTTTPTSSSSPNSDTPPTPTGYSAFRYDGLLRLKRVDFAADNCMNLVDNPNLPASSSKGLMDGIMESTGDAQEPEIISLVRAGARERDTEILFI